MLAIVAGSIGAGIGIVVARRQNSPATVRSAAGGATASGIAARVAPGVVDVTSTLGFQNGTAAGTGMILTSSGDVLTNNHVINGATKVTVQVDGAGRIYTARVVGTDATDDVALLHIDGASGLKTVKLGDSSKVAVGDPVIAIGNALNLQGPPTVTNGTVTAVGQSITANDPGGAAENLTGLIETNAALRPGDSGGPLVNGSGQVIGMDTAASAGRRLRSGASAAFAIPINRAKSIADQIAAGQASAAVHIGPTAFLGVQLQRDSAGSTNTPGAGLSGVVPNGPAQTAGLAAGDTIVTFDGKTVTTAADLTRLLGTHHPGDRVEVVWRDPSGSRHSATVRLISGPAA